MRPSRCRSCSGVVEPDASGIGGDGQAVLFLSGMAEPSVVDFKDQTPGGATLDNPRIFRGARLVGDGPLSANIPGVVAGMDYLYSRYGSGRISWSELIAPAVAYAEQGFVLDQTLPSSIAEGRQYFQKYTAAARIFLPNGRVPKPGDRFFNRDYAATLRTIASEGAESFYRGSLARRIAADMQANDGLITYDDLAQYRAIERKPVSGHYRGHVLFTGGPPVSAGVSLLEAFQVLANYKPRAGRDACAAMPSTGTTSSSRGSCAIAWPASPIRRSGRSTSTSISMPRTRRTCSIGSIRVSRRCFPRIQTRSAEARNASAAARAASWSPMSTAT